VSFTVRDEFNSYATSFLKPVIHVPTNPNTKILNNSGIKYVTFKLRYKIVLATIQSSYLSRRDTQGKKDEDKKPTPPPRQQNNKRPQRDVTGTVQPQKQPPVTFSQPTPSTGAKKEEKNQ
jgi:hypothetical protein